jgi:hypothetical protein
MGTEVDRKSPLLSVPELGVVVVCGGLRLWSWCPAAAGAREPGNARLSLPSLKLADGQDEPGRGGARDRSRREPG